MFFLLENMVSPEKTLTDGQENQKGDGGQQSEGEGERTGEDLGDETINSDFGEGVMTLKTFAVLIVITFYSDHDNYAIHRIFTESGGIDVAKKR